MRKKALYFMIVVLCVTAAGCETLPKKFIRKKPKPEHTPAVVYLEQGSYQKKYSNEYYYKTHYTLWKTWQDDILGNLNGNYKKLLRSVEEAQSQLTQMSHYLKPEKSAELQPNIDELAKFAAKFRNSVYTHTDIVGMRGDLERIRRSVANNFYYDKVKEDLLPDNVDLGEGA